MADKIGPPSEEDIRKIDEMITAEIEENNDLTDYIQQNKFSSLLSRFGEAEEDESLRNEGFELAQKGGLVRKPRPDSYMPYGEDMIREKDDISTESGSELSRVFDSARSNHDGDKVTFEDLDLVPAPSEEQNNISEVQPVVEEKEQEIPVVDEPPKKKRGRPRKNPLPEKVKFEPVAEEPPKKKRGRPRKNPLPEEVKPEPVVEESPKEETPIEEGKALVFNEPLEDNEEVVVVKKYNTHTRVVFVDDELDDGIKRNSEKEIFELFDKSEKKRRFQWFRKKK